jgi:antitoxin FitA
MPALMIADVDETVLARLRERASANGRTLEAEVRFILQQALETTIDPKWRQVNVLHDQLAVSGRAFSGSADLLREDRER